MLIIYYNKAILFYPIKQISRIDVKKLNNLLVENNNGAKTVDAIILNNLFII